MPGRPMASGPIMATVRPSLRRGKRHAKRRCMALSPAAVGGLDRAKLQVAGEAFWRR